MVLDAQPFDLVGAWLARLVGDSVDMNVAVAPLQVVNRLLKWMPFLGYVLGGGVYAVPVGVRGKLSDPQIVPVAPTAVAEEPPGRAGANPQGAVQPPGGAAAAGPAE